MRLSGPIWKMKRLAIAILVCAIGIGQLLAAPHAKRLTTATGTHTASVRLALASASTDEHEQRATPSVDALVAAAVPPPPIPVVAPRNLDTGDAVPDAVPLLAFAPKHSPPPRS